MRGIMIILLCSLPYSDQNFPDTLSLYVIYYVKFNIWRYSLFHKRDEVALSSVSTKIIVPIMAEKWNIYCHIHVSK